MSALELTAINLRHFSLFACPFDSWMIYNTDTCTGYRLANIRELKNFFDFIRRVSMRRSVRSRRSSYSSGLSVIDSSRHWRNKHTSSSPLITSLDLFDNVSRLNAGNSRKPLTRLRPCITGLKRITAVSNFRDWNRTSTFYQAPSLLRITINAWKSTRTGRTKPKQNDLALMVNALGSSLSEGYPLQPDTTSMHGMKLGGGVIYPTNTTADPFHSI
jgi:hypothetical protein